MTLNSSATKRSRPIVVRAPHPLVFTALATFGYLLWLHFTLFIKSNSLQYVPGTQFDDNPVSGVRISESSRLKKLANDLAASFSAEDRITSFDRQGFEVSFLDQGSKSKCSCDIVSTDCLDMIACMTDLHSRQKRNALAWMGKAIRSSMKANVNFETKIGPIYTSPFLPLGKQLQYHTMGSWRSWRTRNVMYEYNSNIPSIFIQPLLYPECQGALDENGDPTIIYNGVSCFYQSIKDPEESTGTIIEDEAELWYNSTIKNGKATENQIRNIWDKFLQKHQVVPREPPPDSKDFHISDSSDIAAAEYKTDFSALGNLVLFAHLARMGFNRRPFLDQIYKGQLTAVVTPKPENSIDSGNSYADANGGDPFIVSLHMRRGDSCGIPDPKHYEQNASALDSKAQMGSERKCYRNEVYLRAIARIRELVPKGRPLHVYLSTDDVGNVMRDILTSKYDASLKNDEGNVKQTANEVSSDDLGVEKWYFLNITRDHFDVDVMVENPTNADKQPKLGESAVTDLWLLSHGHAFVGHLGSRFGKASWLLATARRNSFIPFFSVDGHSFCCEIDENCAAAKPFITVSNCLSFGHEYSHYNHSNYWVNGSVARRDRVAKDNERKAKKNTPNGAR